MQDNSLVNMVMFAVALLFSLTVHEYAHGRAALAAGDDTAKLSGRLSLNPIDHLDPIGSIFMLFMIYSGFGIGWAKPVPVNPLRFKHPRWDNLKVSLWGPLSNLILAVIFAAIFDFVMVPYAGRSQQGISFAMLIYICIRVNLSLAIFNLIPIPPLDGSHILSSLLPYEMARRYEMAISRYGMVILVAIMLTGVLGYILGPPIHYLMWLLTLPAQLVH